MYGYGTKKEAESDGGYSMFLVLPFIRLLSTGTSRDQNDSPLSLELLVLRTQHKLNQNRCTATLKHRASIS